MLKELIQNDIELLYDLKDGANKEVAWKAHKLVTIRLAQAYKTLGHHNYDKILHCGSYLEFRRYSDNTMRLHTANFCQTRLCPTCLWRRSRKMFAQMRQIIDAINTDYPHYRYLFLTLTIKNPTATNFAKSINDLLQGYKMLCLRKDFMTAVKGWFRAIEVTLNWENNTYHPHIHAVMVVDGKTYFDKNNNEYITHDNFVKLWQKCLKVDYLPSVRISPLTESKKGAGKEIAEVCKYPLKPSNLMADLRDVNNFLATSDFDEDEKATIKKEARNITNAQTEQFVKTLEKGLRFKRLIGFGGLFKEKHRELHLDDAETGDLITAAESVKNAKGDTNYSIEKYYWNVRLRNYVLSEGGLNDT